MHKISSREPIEEIAHELEFSRARSDPAKRIFETLIVSGPPDPPRASA